jgi:hypothetical protein
MGIVTRHRSRRSCLDSDLRNTRTAAQHEPIASIPMHNPSIVSVSERSITSARFSDGQSNMLLLHRLCPPSSSPVSLAQRPFFIVPTLPCMLTTDVPSQTTLDPPTEILIHFPFNHSTRRKITPVQSNCKASKAIHLDSLSSSPCQPSPLLYFLEGATLPLRTRLTMVASSIRKARVILLSEKHGCKRCGG